MNTKRNVASSDTRLLLFRIKLDKVGPVVAGKLKAASTMTFSLAISHNGPWLATGGGAPFGKQYKTSQCQLDLPPCASAKYLLITLSC
jgi:hypothetical protein